MQCNVYMVLLFTSSDQEDWWFCGVGLALNLGKGILLVAVTLEECFIV